MKLNPNDCYGIVSTTHYTYYSNTETRHHFRSVKYRYKKISNMVKSHWSQREMYFKCHDVDLQSTSKYAIRVIIFIQ